MPSAGDFAQNHPEAENRAGYVKEHLDDVGPDHRGHAALVGVEQGQAENRDDGSFFPGAEHDGDYQRDGHHAHALGEHAQQQERAGRELADAVAEADAHQFIGGVHLAAEIGGQKEGRDHDAGQEIAQHHLQEAEVALKR